MQRITNSPQFRRINTQQSNKESKPHLFRYNSSDFDTLIDIKKFLKKRTIQHSPKQRQSKDSQSISRHPTSCISNSGSSLKIKHVDSKYKKINQKRSMKNLINRNNFNINLFYNTETLLPKTERNDILINFDKLTNSLSNKTLSVFERNNKRYSSSNTESRNENKKKGHRRYFLSCNIDNDNSAQKKNKNLVLDLSSERKMKLKSKLKEKKLGSSKQIKSKFSNSPEQYKKTLMKKRTIMPQIKLLDRFKINKNLLSLKSKKSKTIFDWKNESSDTSFNNNMIISFDENEDNSKLTNHHNKFLQKLSNKISLKNDSITKKLCTIKENAFEKTLTIFLPVMNDLLINNNCRINHRKKIKLLPYLSFLHSHAKSSHKFERAYFKYLTSTTSPLIILNHQYIQSLLHKYLSVDIPNKIYKEHYLETKTFRNSYSSYVLSSPIKDIQYEKEKRMTRQALNVPMIVTMTSSDLYFYNNFCIVDFPYFVFPHIRKLYKDNKLIISPSPRNNKRCLSNRKKKRTKTNFFNALTSVISHNIKECIIDQNPLTERYTVEKDKTILVDSLVNNHFYNRKSTNSITSNSTNEKIDALRASIRRSQKKLSQKIEALCCKEFTDECSCVNKTNVISRTYELKQKLLQSFQSQSDTIFFYIKDRNYHQFKNLFEKSKCNLEMKDLEGNTMLSLAVQSNSTAIVSFLLHNGANANTANNKGNTPLHYALSHHNYEIADMLIKKGANENVVNLNGTTPWQCLDVNYSIV